MKKGGHKFDLTSCRGHGIIFGTCDAARERETSKELVNLLSEMIDLHFPLTSVEIPAEQNAVSVEDMLKSELEEAKNISSVATKPAVSINTDVKGMTLIRINRNDVCPVLLVKHVFDKVKLERLPCTRHVVRLIPLQIAFYPGETELVENLASVVAKPTQLTGSKRKLDDCAEESTPSALDVKYKYNISFKARNHNVLTKSFVINAVRGAMPPSTRYDYKDFSAMVVVEALKNIGGASLIEDYHQYMDFNLRKFQAAHASNEGLRPEETVTAETHT